MPLIHERTFRVRHYECDAYGHVNNVAYLRYMQETAFDASAAAGYDAERYAQMGRQWLIHETDIEYQQSLVYGDTVRVKTWVGDFQRVRSRRMYELYNHQTNGLVAKAHTDWAFVETATGRPTAIPAEFAQAFFPEGVPASFPLREKIPTPPPAPAGAFAMRRRVQWQDLDAMGHVNNTNYVAYIGECAFEDCRTRGWSIPQMQTAGFAILVRQHQVEYKLPAMYGDELEIKTWISDVKRVSAVRHFTISRVGDGGLLARVRSWYVWADWHTHQPIRIPADFLADFKDEVV